MHAMPTSPRGSFEGLSIEQKRSLLRQLLAKKVDSALQPFALSRGQQALWFLQRLIPDTAAYNVPIPLRFTPPLDFTAFTTALDALVARHPALRTTCSENEGHPWQQVAATTPCHVEQRTAPASDALLEQQVIADYQRPFSMDGPLFRATIWRGESADVLLLTVHHLMFDATSAGIVLHDLTRLYRAALGEDTAPLPALPASYRDFVTFQENLLDSAEGARLWEFWADTLTGDLADLALPRNPLQPEDLTLRGTSIPFTIPPDRTARIRALAQAQRTTVYAVIFTAVQALLYHFTGQSNLAIGAPVAGRTRADWAEVVGYFVNTLPIRIPFRVDSTFAAYLRTVHDHLGQALDHQDFPFPSMVERLKVARDPGRSPIFQVIVNVTQPIQRVPELTEHSGPTNHGWRFGNSSAEPFVIPQLEGQVDLSVDVFDTRDEMFGSWKYGTQSLEHATAEHLLRQFQMLLDLAAENPNVPMRDLLARLPDITEPPQDHDVEREEVTF
jgi:hypothetical protein